VANQLLVVLPIAEDNIAAEMISSIGVPLVVAED